HFRLRVRDRLHRIPRRHHPRPPWLEHILLGTQPRRRALPPRRRLRRDGAVRTNPRRHPARPRQPRILTSHQHLHEETDMNPPAPSTPSAQVPRWVIALASGILGLGAGYGIAPLTADDTTSSAASDSTSGNDPRPVDNTPTTAPDDAFDTPPVLPEPEDF